MNPRGFWRFGVTRMENVVLAVGVEVLLFWLTEADSTFMAFIKGPSKPWNLVQLRSVVDYVKFVQAMYEYFEGVAYLVIWNLLIPVDEGLNSSHRIAFLDGKEDIPWSHDDVLLKEKKFLE